MASSLSEFADRTDLGARLLPFSRDYFSSARGDVFLQRGSYAEASVFPHSNPWPGWIRCVAWADRPGAVRARRSRTRSRHLLVFDESCGIHVPLYLVSWHVPALPL